jgi:PKD repeat protein
MCEDSFGSMEGIHRGGRALASLRDFVRALQILPVLLLLVSPLSALAVNVLTQHNDSFRTGANLSENVLTVSNVGTSQFGKLFSPALDGQIYAQPLYVAGLMISNNLHNVLYVETEHNSVYALDADNPSVSNALWHVNLGTPVPIADINDPVGGPCGDLQPEVGITGTPVIDLTKNTMYLVAKTRVVTGSVTSHFQKLHALDLLTGQEKFGGPVAIQGSVPGTGVGSSGGTLTFDPLYQHSRAGLLLLSNTVYVAFGSHCDYSNYHGWLFGFNTTNLQQTAIFCTSPNAGGGPDDGGSGIWGSGMGPAADADGNIYVTTGNGALDKNTGGLDYGDSLLKLSVSNSTLVVADWFSPHDQVNMFTNDLDLGAGGPVVIPSTNLLALIGKTGEVYLINRQHLGGFVNFSSDTNIVQEFSAVTNTYFIGQSLVYWNGPTNQFLFFWTHGMPVQAYSFNGASIATNPVATGSTVQSTDRVGGISLSANGNAPGSGILWGTEAGSGGTLHAYDATNVAHELWNSQQMAARDALGSYTKFCAPTIANGKVYVPTTSSNLVVYGLLGTPSQGVSPANFNFGALTTGTTAQTSFLVTNTGGGILLGTVATAGPFAIVSGGSYSLAGAGSTNVVVSFTPPSPGGFTNSVVFTSNGGVSTNAVTGTGLTPGSIAVTPATLNFGALATGTTAQASFVVTNSGGTAVSNGTAIVSGGPFTIQSGATFSVSGLGSTNVLVRFAPVSVGGFTTNAIFTTANGGNATNTVTGAGAVAPVASFTAHPITGTEPVGVTFSNTSTGTQPLTLYWNLGDSVLVTNSGSANFNHTYAAGTYTVVLTASNAFGMSTLVSNNMISVITALQAWQLHYFGCTNCAQAQPNADPYGTGMSNTNRFLTGFNPTNTATYLHIINIANTNTTDINVIYLGANGDINWSPGIASRTNVLELTAGTAGGDYSNNFVSANVTNILSGGTGTGIVTNMVNAGGATNTPSRFYRIRVLVP